LLCHDDSGTKGDEMSDILQIAKNPTSRSVIKATLFDGLGPDQQARLAAQGVLRRFAAGQIIQQRGDDARGFWLIRSGQVAVGQFGPDGDFDAVALLGPGDSYGELAMLAGSPRVVDAVAQGSVEAMLIRADALERLLAEDPATMRRLLAGLAAQLQETIDMVVLMRRSQGFERIARLLVILSGDRPLPASISITQQGLADLTGTSRQTVNEALRLFEDHGAIRRGYGAIVLTDRRILTATPWRRGQNGLSTPV